uniref:MADF domain-containing protein n=1 Tax=Magallana gigas TaxID=29159 RepID=A0A8W8IL95_MAGGI
MHHWRKNLNTNWYSEELRDGKRLIRIKLVFYGTPRFTTGLLGQSRLHSPLAYPCTSLVLFQTLSNKDATQKRSCKLVIAKSKNQVVDETCITQASEDAPENNTPSDTGVASTKTRLQPLYLTSIQQDYLVSWFQEHEYLYDKGNAGYKLTERKNALWKEKAEELGVCDGPRLKSWMDSIRTQYAHRQNS